MVGVQVGGQPDLSGDRHAGQGRDTRTERYSRYGKGNFRVSKLGVC